MNNKFYRYNDGNPPKRTHQFTVERPYTANDARCTIVGYRDVMQSFGRNFISEFAISHKYLAAKLIANNEIVSQDLFFVGEL